MEVEEAIEKLRDHKLLVRDSGVAALQCLLTNCEIEERRKVSKNAVDQVKELIRQEVWESRHGGFCAAKVLLPFFAVDDKFSRELEELALTYLEDTEVRVRLAVGECLWALAQQQGSDLYVRIKGSVYKSIGDNLKGVGNSAVDTPDGSVLSYSDDCHGDPSPEGPQLKRIELKGRCLETSLKALQRLMEGLGDKIELPVDSEIWVLIRRAASHPNRYVRETGFFALSALCQRATQESLKGDGLMIAEGLALGLADNWSQVRYGASIATRKFMSKSFPDHNSYYPQLLPAMCLNRYYSAEGVRLFSQETWKVVLGESGKEEVGNHIRQVVEHYISQSCAENPQIRESTCHCIGELVVKIDHKKIGPFVQSLLVALMDCYQDLSWHVRDAACSGLNQAITEFPEEAQHVMPKLYELLFAHLGDKVCSVRENTAFTLGTAMSKYNLEAIEKVVTKLHQIFQLSENISESHLCSSTAHLHEKPCCSSPGTQQVHGTLCSSQRVPFSAPVPESASLHTLAVSDTLPWEASDGAIYLLRELSKVDSDRATPFLSMLAKLTQCPRFQQNQYLLETVYRLLPCIAQNMGKRQFKPYLELYIGPLFAALESGQRLAETASGACISKLMAFIGPNVFKSRLDEFQLRALHASPFLYSNTAPQRAVPNVSNH